MRAHPGIIIVPKGGTSKDDLPSPEAVTQVVSDGLDTGSWPAAELVIDVRQDVYKIQDEWPPEPPIDVVGIGVTLAQCPVTRPAGYDGPFRLALDALESEYGDKMELHIAGVTL